MRFHDARGTEVCPDSDIFTLQLPSWHPEAETLNGRLVKVRRVYTLPGQRDPGTAFLKSWDAVAAECIKGKAFPFDWLKVVD